MVSVHDQLILLFTARCLTVQPSLKKLWAWLRCIAPSIWALEVPNLRDLSSIRCRIVLHTLDLCRNFFKECSLWTEEERGKERERKRERESGGERERWSSSLEESSDLIFPLPSILQQSRFYLSLPFFRFRDRFSKASSSLKTDSLLWRTVY